MFISFNVIVHRVFSVCVIMYLSMWTCCGFKTIARVHYPRTHGLQLQASTADRVDLHKDTRSYLLSTAGVILPTLSRTDKAALLAGERVQKQDRRGHAGYGMVVLDVPSSPDVVFDALKSFDRYMEMIPTVRSVKIFNSNEKNTLAEFSLSKFCLKVNVMHTVLREQRLIKFGLDASRPNPVLRQAEGFWYVHAPNDRPNNSGWSRVYLSTNIVVSRMIPSIIVDYAAARALPRATTWLESFDFASITSK